MKTIEFFQGFTSSLTTGQDVITGTAGNDTFTAPIINNANTLQSGDKIVAGAGTLDRLSADVGTSQNFAITAETTGVEQVAIRAQAVASDTNNNNMLNSLSGQAQIDAQRMVGVTQWESNNSRADVVIEDVRILASQITKDITIAMVETDPGNVDMGVYFDQYSLRAQANSSSTLTLQIMDTRSQAAGTGPLKDSPYNGFTFSLTLPGATTAKLVTLQSTAIDDAQTYAALVAAIQVEVEKSPDLAGFTVSLGNAFQVSDTLGSIQTGTEILLTTTTGATVASGATGTGWIAIGPVPASSGLHTNMSTAATNTTDLVTSKIILDDVGRGSTGGDLVVGGLSVGDTSSSLGVQRFEIEVRDNSKLQTINSTNNTLREVKIVNGETTSSSFAYGTTTKNAGDLTVNGMVASNVDNDNTALPGTTVQHNAYGFSDVRLIDGSSMTGKLAFTAEVTTASIAKYLNLTDTGANPSADNVAFVYTGGGNNDTMSVMIDGTVAGSTNTLTGREDFTFSIDGGNGNDTIKLDVGGGESAAWYIDQKLNANITVNGGAGNDTITTTGGGDVKIDAGAGNDTVYADNSGAVGAVWAVSAGILPVAADLQAEVSVNTGNSFLYKGKLTVAFTGAGDAGLGGAVTAGAADSVAANFTNGWEVVVDIPTGTNYVVNQFYVNQAIKAAINSDAVLSKLLTATDGPGNTLTIASKIDGNFLATDLSMTVSAVDVTTLTLSEQSTVLSAYKAFASNSLATIATAQVDQALSVTNKNLVSGMDAAHVLMTDTGSISTASSDNTITMGLGDDVVVLGTSAADNDTLVYVGYGLGKDTIVNYSDAGANIDKLDFKAYLLDKESLSGSVESQTRIVTTLNGNLTVEANSVTVLNGAFNTTTDTFAGLTDAKFLAAINSSNTGTLNYAGITAGTLDAVNAYTTTGAPTTLVGGTGHGVVLVQNNLNEGEYAVFELTFNGTATNTLVDFSAAKLIGVLDFGHTVAFTAPQLA